MCGIFGHFHPGGADPTLVERMARCLDHRGPDGFGTHADGRIAFGAGRLAIIDLSAPAGVLFNEDRTVGVAFNGEIYNFRALRAELEAAGHRFATHTDTEVIVHGYESWGVGVLERLRGMFAIALWDAGRGQLLLARDRLGEKPLYYTQAGDHFLFASEVKALFEFPGLRRAVNTEILPYHMTLGYTPAPLTLFAGILKLEPGCFLQIGPEGAPSVRRYWEPTMRPLENTRRYPDAVQAVRAAVTEAVQGRMISDVPIGAFLSGGIDSTTVVGLMNRLTGRPTVTFTVGYAAPAGTQDTAKFHRKFNADAHFARLAADRLKTEHHAVLIPQDERLAWLLPRLVYAADEPIAEPATILTAYIAALARRDGVPVLLTGDGGDELFAGYHAYRADQVLARYLRIPGPLRSAINPLLARLPGARFDSARKLAAKSRQTGTLQRYLHWYRLFDPAQIPAFLQDAALGSRVERLLGEQLLPRLNAPHTHDFADRIAYTGLRLWLAEQSNMRVDKMCMAMSIEARAPLEDHLLADLALSLPLSFKLRSGDFKTVFKEAFADLLPPEILRREKVGFFPPASEWLRTALRPLVREYLAPERVAAVGIFRPEAVSALVEAHIERREYHMWTLWILLTFHLWHALYISGDLTLPGPKLTPADLTGEPASL